MLIRPSRLQFGEGGEEAGLPVEPSPTQPDTVDETLLNEGIQVTTGYPDEGGCLGVVQNLAVVGRSRPPWL